MLVTKPFTFSVGAVIIASQHNSDFDTIYSDYNGNITDANVASGAAIAYSKLSLTASIQAGDLTSALSKFLVPSGGIIMWSGTVATIPSGWFLCNGSNSTPDLRNLFIVGADADSGGVAKTTYTGAATQTGGSLHHTHPVSGTTTGPSATQLTAGSNAAVGNNVHTHDFSVTSGNESVVPVAYYALAFIMKQ